MGVRNDPSKTTYPFDTLFALYDAWYEKEPGKSLFTIEVNALQAVQNWKQGRSLEIGVGTGRFAEVLSIQFGVDLAFNPLTMARGRGILPVNAEGEYLPFRNSSFDTCLMMVTLCFARNPVDILRETSRVLKMGGKVVLGMVLRESPWGQIYQKLAENGHPFYSLATFFTRKEVLHMLRRTGFRVIKTFSTLFQPPGRSTYLLEPIREGYYPASGFTVFSAEA